VGENALILGFFTSLFSRVRARDKEAFRANVIFYHMPLEKYGGGA
jgi:hypothetical protein